MIQLVSKVQYSTYEIGEFSDVSPRLIEQLFELIECFPWQQQRDHLSVQLTNPSITIEKEDGEYLKLAVYYSGRFVLYYLHNKQELYKKSFPTYQAAYPYIKSYYQSDTFDTSEFKKENTWAKNVVKHFITQDFNYVVDQKRAFAFLRSTSAINLSLTAVFLVIFSVLDVPARNRPPGILLFMIILFIGGGINLIYFFNYYIKTRGWRLIMSRGDDIFYYGTQSHLAQFNKQDIVEVVIHKDRNGRSPLRDFVIVCIQFNNGQRIQIPSIFLDDYALRAKLYMHKPIEKHFPKWLKGNLVNEPKA